MALRTQHIGKLAIFAGLLINMNLAAAQAAPNRPPTISGSPPTSVAAGSAYAFTPTASDPDRRTWLRFSISNKPAWAYFNPWTGKLSGTPAGTHAGTTTGIVIRVSDGRLSTALPAFAITVQPVAASGTATLSWQAPTQYTDGTALPASELAAYRIYRGTSPVSLTRVAEVDGRALTFTVQQLPAGTHYFAITAVTEAGAESALSAVGSKTIPR